MPAELRESPEANSIIIARLAAEVGSLYAIIQQSKIKIPAINEQVWNGRAQFKHWYTDRREQICSIVEESKAESLHQLDDIMHDTEFFVKFLEDACPNCILDKATIQLRCGHSFCETCVISLIQHRGRSSKTKACFTCFQPVDVQEFAHLIPQAVSPPMKEEPSSMCISCSVKPGFDGFGFCKHYCLLCMLEMIKKGRAICESDDIPFTEPVVQWVNTAVFPCALCNRNKSLIKEFSYFPCCTVCNDCVRLCYARRKCVPCDRRLTAREIGQLNQKKILRCELCKKAMKFNPSLKCQCFCGVCSIEERCSCD